MFESYQEYLSYYNEIDFETLDRLNMESQSSSSSLSSSSKAKAKQKSQNAGKRNSYDKVVMRDILKNFNCPFKEEVQCRFDAKPDECIFGHETVAPGIALLEIPSFVCIFNLINRCYKLLNADNKCIYGFHLSPEELLDCERFKRDNQEKYQRYYSEESFHNCGICLDTIELKRFVCNRKFALLECCDHTFCSKCIKDWRLKSIKCPICRVESARYVVTKNYYPNGSTKNKIFKTRNPPVNICLGPIIAFYDQDEQ
ncbi:hypothetical protein SSS_00313 [Sarcoptes scabiei]|uniref:RING-type domain-containing protein n=1 Tax=Sarcoptes scabiei TaxID=52283 RepID=A0A834RF30_SARSC|nr:hypothetical protein SSS_00313 [Sarcoptes scabiei]